MTNILVAKYFWSFCILQKQQETSLLLLLRKDVRYSKMYKT